MSKYILNEDTRHNCQTLNSVCEALWVDGGFSERDVKSAYEEEVGESYPAECDKSNNASFSDDGIRHILLNLGVEDAEVTYSDDKSCYEVTYSR